MNASSKRAISSSSPTSPEKFATLFYGLLDTRNDKLTYTNAGHENPLFLHEGQLIPLLAGGPPLGVVDGFSYEKDSVKFAGGDLLVIYSDGITDAVNSEGDRFGIERLQEVVRKSSTRSADEISTEILSGVSRHIADTPQFDDMTLLVIKKLR